MDKVSSCCVDFYQLPIIHFLLGDSFHPGGTQLTSRLASQLLLGPGDKVLDLASGKGTSSLFLAEHFGCEVVSVDLATKNLKETNNLAIARGLGNVVWPVTASADNLPFIDEYFDAVICECALCTFRFPFKVLTEVRRVLKKNGRLGLSDVCLNAELPGQLNTIVNQVLCIAGARSQTGYLSLLESAGYRVGANIRVDQVLYEMLNNIEKRIGLLSTVSNNPISAQLSWYKEDEKAFARVSKFIRNGGLGYLMLVGVADS